MRYPSITALRALDAVARLGSVTAAAQQLSLTRSAISHQIISLEQSLGFALTERVGRGIGSGKGKTAGRGQKGAKSRYTLNLFCGGYSSVGRVPDCDSGCRGFESH